MAGTTSLLSSFSFFFLCAFPPETYSLWTNFAWHIAFLHQLSWGYLWIKQGLDIQANARITFQTCRYFILPSWFINSCKTKLTTSLTIAFVWDQAQANGGWKSYRDALENGKAGKMDTWTASESVVNPLIGGWSQSCVLEYATSWYKCFIAHKFMS